MKPDSTSYENILEVENQGSQLSTFYKIMSPVQITLESCTGLGKSTNTAFRCSHRMAAGYMKTLWMLCSVRSAPVRCTATIILS